MWREGERERERERGDDPEKGTLKEGGKEGRKQMVRWDSARSGAGYTAEIGPLSTALSASINRICELIKTAARWCIMKKI